MKFSQQSVPNMKFRTTEPRGSVLDFKAEMMTHPERLFTDTQSRSPIGIVFVVLMILSFLFGILFGFLKLGYPCAYCVIAFFVFIFLNVLLFPKNRDDKNSYRGQQTFAKFALGFLGLALAFTVLMQMGVIVTAQVVAGDDPAENMGGIRGGAIVITPLTATFLAFAVLTVIAVICIVMPIVNANRLNKAYNCSSAAVVIGYLDRLAHKTDGRGYNIDILETTPVFRLNYNGRYYEVYTDEFVPFDEVLPVLGQSATVYFSGNDPYLCRLTPKAPKFTSVTIIGIILAFISLSGMGMVGMAMLTELLKKAQQ